MDFGLDNNAKALADLLKGVGRKASRAKRALKGRRLAQKILTDELGVELRGAEISSYKIGVIVIDTPSSAQFQELESFQREKLIEVFREKGLAVRELRIRLAPR